MITEMQTLEYQISTTLSATVEDEMELICAEVLLQKSVSYVDELDQDSLDDTKEPEPTPYIQSSTKYEYTKLPIPSTTHGVSCRKYNNKLNRWNPPKHDVVVSESVNIDLNRLSSITQYNKPYHQKWCKLFTNLFFCNRIIILFITLILLFLSWSYCIKQVIQVNIELIDAKSCGKPNTNQHILYDSYISIFKHKYNIRNSSYDDSCWTMVESEHNSSNKYQYEWKFVNDLNIKFILFSCIVCYALIIILYNIVSIIIDICYIKRNIIHTKSQLFKATQTEIAVKQYNRWVIICVFSESIEIIIQSIILLFYNGYHILDKDNIYISENQSLIILFTIIICFNSFSCGFLWMIYALASQYCSFILIQSYLYYIDIGCNLLYVMFPFLIVVYDHFDENIYEISILYADKDTNCTLLFFAIFTPLFFACNQCLFMLCNSINQMRNNFYQQWKATQPQTIKIKSDESTPIKTKLKINNRNMHTIGWIKRIFLCIISISFVMYSFYLLTFVLSHFHTTQLYCHLITESSLNSMNGTLTIEQINLLNTNPELILYDKCTSKIYPFIHNNNNQCQCKQFNINWIDIDIHMSYINENNFTQNDLLNGIIEHWYSLEEFESCFTQNEVMNCTLDMFINDKCHTKCLNNQYCKTYNLSTHFLIQSVVFENHTMSYYKGKIFNCLEE